MLFDPSILVREPLAVLAVVLIIMVGKSLAAFAIVLAFRYPVRTALTVSASLAQIGEFSFILAGLGVALGLLPPEGRDLILAGALLSITLNPLVFAGRRPVALGCAAGRTAARLERAGDDLADAGRSTARAARPRHHRRLRPGRRAIGEALQAPGPAVRGRRAGPPPRRGAARSRALPPSMATPPRRACSRRRGVERARLLVVATPDGFQARA